MTGPSSRPPDPRRTTPLSRIAVGLLAGVAACAPVLRVGTSGDYPPFSERTPGGGWRGFDVEVARAFARDSGRRLVLVPVRWPELEAALDRREFEVAMSGVTVRADRLLAGRFTAAVARATAVLAAPRGAPAPRRVGVNRGGHLERLARAELPGAEIVIVDDNRLAALLESGGVDGLVTDSLELPRLGGDLAVVRTLSDDRKAYFLRVDGARLADEIDAWLAAREDDGWLPALRARWLGDGDPAPAPAAVARVVDLVARRLMLMPAVAAAKRAAGLPILDPVREARVEARAAARAVAAGLAPEPAAAFVRAQIAAAREVQVAAAPAGDAPTLDAVRAAIDRIDDTLLAALAAAVPIATAPDVLAAAITRDAAVPGLGDGRTRALAAALRALRPSGAPADAGLRGLTASRKLAFGRGVRAEPERRERDGIARWPAGWGRQRGAGG